MKDKFYIKFKNPLIAIVIFSLIGGYFAFKKTETALLPNVVFPKVKIIAENGEQPVDKMMITTTRPLEDAIKQVPFLLRMACLPRRETRATFFLSPYFLSK